MTASPLELFKMLVVDDDMASKKRREPETPDLSNTEPIFWLCCEECPRCAHPYWIWGDPYDTNERVHICARCERQWQCEYAKGKRDG